jgi:hypothetical protein
LTADERAGFQREYQAATTGQQFMALARRMDAAGFTANPREGSSLDSYKQYFRRNFGFTRT